jgi:RNA polymerase sigma-70 factor (ECF subfamily)
VVHESPYDDLTTLSDEQLIAEIRAGNRRRYTTLVDRHKDRAMTLAYRLTGNRQDAEELVQDAFVRAFRALDQFRGESRFSTWLYRVVYNTCMTRVTRRRGKPERVEMEEDEMERMFVDAESPSTLERLEERELQALIEKEIQSLPEKYRAVVTLFYLEDTSYEDIAAILDAPLGTVKTNLFRARSILKERVTRQWKEGEAVI